MEFETANRIQSVQEYYFSKKLREIAQMNQKSNRKVINLGIGSPDLPPHPKVIETLQQSAANPQHHAYQSYRGIPALREAIAHWYAQKFQVTLEPSHEVLPLMGSKEGIMHISMTYLNPGDEVLIPNPGYPTYAAVTKLAEAHAIPYALEAENNWLPDLAELEKRDLSKVKLMWVNYPHMPTGTAVSPSFFKELVAFAKRNHILLCNDNPYSFILNEHPQSILSIEGAKEVAIELNSLSKSHNMAGWRVGALLGKAEIINEIVKFKTNMDSGMYLPVQEAAVVALGLTDDWYASLNQVYAQRREKVWKMLDVLNCSYAKNQVGMFVWAKISDDWSKALTLSNHFLYEAHVFITPGFIFGNRGDRYIRISLCNTIEVFEEALERIQCLPRWEERDSVFELAKHQ
ncbi:MAG: pyridoxal phosphate-dependent aminotransferase [Flammeovirgaceae bacterium]